MNEVVASERRLSAALDRIDQFLEAGPRRAASAGDGSLQAELEATIAEKQRLAEEIAKLQSNSVEASASAETKPITDTSDQLSRLAAANEELIIANRALMDLAESDDTMVAIRAACDAEVEALRAARYAEIANLAEIMGELDRLLAQEKATGPKTSGRDKSASKAAQPSFSGIYGDAPDEDDQEEGR